MAKKKINLKNNLNGNELDLSMSRLTDIPVSEIASIPKATNIDLSNNEIVRIPHSFANLLSHVTKIDLSSNKLRDLPQNFGSLVNLQHLDLYNNQLTDLPLTLSSLPNLQYLDLKNNPLRVDLASAAGNCLNSKECHLAARKILAHLRFLKSEKDREYLIRDLKEKKKKMTKQRQDDEGSSKERERKKPEKKASIEKKKGDGEGLRKQQQQQQQQLQQQQQQLQQRRQQLQQQQQQQQQKNNHENGSLSHNGKSNKRDEKRNRKSTGKWSVLGVINMILLFGILIAIGVCAVIYTDGDLSVEGFQAAWPRVQKNSVVLLNRTREAVKVENLKSTARSIWKVVGPYALKVQDTLLMGLSASRNLILTSVQALQSVTGDLSPYFDGLKPYLTSFWDLAQWAIERVVDFVTRADWTSVQDGVRWFYGFLVDQFKILHEELWRNEAVVSLWKDMKPFREFLWDNTVTLRFYYWTIYTELEDTWLPATKEVLYTAYTFSKEKLESVF